MRLRLSLYIFFHVCQRFPLRLHPPSRTTPVLTLRQAPSVHPTAILAAEAGCPDRAGTYNVIKEVKVPQLFTR